MIALPGLAAPVAAGFVVALAFFPALGCSRRSRLAWIMASSALLLVTPYLVAARHPFVRFLAGVVALALAAKLIDLHTGVGRGFRPGFGTFAAFLVNPGSVVLRKLGDTRRPGRAEERSRLAWGGLGTAAGGAFLVAVFRVDWARYPFALEHVVKVVAFFLTLLPFIDALAVVLRATGLRICEPMDRPYLAATPAEFWKRYNLVAHQFFYEDVFRASGGLRAPVRAAVVTFAVSAVAHEYLFAVATGRLRGYQTAFFMAQGLAAAATLRAQPRGWRRGAWVAGTLAFNLATGVLFFECINDVAPFYADRA